MTHASQASFCLPVNQMVHVVETHAEGDTGQSESELIHDFVHWTTFQVDWHTIVLAELLLQLLDLGQRPVFPGWGHRRGRQLRGPPGNRGQGLKI